MELGGASERAVPAEIAGGTSPHTCPVGASSTGAAAHRRPGRPPRDTRALSPRKR